MAQHTNEHRAARRRPAHYQIHFWSDTVDGTGIVADASQTGLFIETRQIPPAGMRLHLEIKLGEIAFFAEGEVARVQKIAAAASPVRHNGIGVRFVPWIEIFDSAKGRVRGIGPSDLQVDLSDISTLRKAFINELSLGGLFVATPEAVEMGDTVKISLRLPAPHAAFAVSGVVVYRSDSPPGLGVQLADVAQIRKQLGDVLGDPTR